MDSAEDFNEIEFAIRSRSQLLFKQISLKLSYLMCCAKLKYTPRWRELELEFHVRSSQWNTSWEAAQYLFNEL